MAKKELTKEMLFNFVAPVFIYHKADLKYKKEAVRSFKTLKTYRNTELIQRYFGDDTNLLSMPARAIDEVDWLTFKGVYDKLFKEFVCNKLPGLDDSYDYYGAKCFRDANRRVYLEGDACDCFPFYLDHEALKERLLMLEEEIA